MRRKYEDPTEHHRKASVAYQARNVAAGRCKYCPDAIVIGNVCQKHREQQNENKRSRYARLRAAGICPFCPNGGLAVVGRSCCQRHLDMYRKKKAVQ